MSDLFLFQLRRIARNRQYVIFTVLLPALFTLFFTQVFSGQASGAAQYQDQAAATMISMMAYGGLGAALGATIRLAFDRSSGWLRQIRVTPLPTGTVLAVEVLVGALLVLPSIVVVALVGRFANDVQFGLGTWLALVVAMWVGAVAFVALGLLLGLLLETQAAGAAMGLSSVVLAALGGLWVPVELFPSALARVAHGLPSYWYAQLGREVAAGQSLLTAVLALAGFSAVFGALAFVAARRRPLHAVAG